MYLTFTLGGPYIPDIDSRENTISREYGNAHVAPLYIGVGGGGGGRVLPT